MKRFVIRALKMLLWGVAVALLPRARDGLLARAAAVRRWPEN